MRAACAPGPPTAAPPDGAEVAVVRWPAEAATRDALAAVGAPRLLLVGADDAPPVVWDAAEDWAREGAGPTELTARLARLAARPSTTPAVAVPVLDADGVLHAADGTVVVVPPIEAALLTALLDRPGEVVRREDLLAAAWPGQERPETALDGRIRHLRRRLAGVTVTIHTVRGVGYLLELG